MIKSGLKWGYTAAASFSGALLNPRQPTRIRFPVIVAQDIQIETHPLNVAKNRPESGNFLDEMFGSWFKC